MAEFAVPYRKTTLSSASRVAALRVLEAGLPAYAGEETERFEVELAAYCGVDYGVATNSGTSALLLILLAAGIGRGDEVILGANDYIGCLSALAMLDATPVFIDTDAETGNIRPELFQAAITNRTRAVIATHMYGLPCDIDEICATGRQHGLVVIEDFAHALGARFRAKPVGSYGDAGFCSFGGKHISVFGPGGAAVTSNRRLAESISSFRDQGRNRTYRISFVRPIDESWYDQERIGLNLHMAEVSAALGRTQLDQAPEWLTQRREAARYLSDRFAAAGLPLKLPREGAHTEHAFLHFTVMTAQRNELREFLEQGGVEAQIHYPHPLHHLGPVRKRWPERCGPMPASEHVSANVLSLPVGPHMTPDNLDFVAGRVEEFFA